MVVAKSLWHINDTISDLRSEKITPIPEFKILQSLYSLISIGTERIVARGQVPEKLYSQMKVPYMMGDFKFPVKYGYSTVVMDDAGTKYHLMHPHQDVIQVMSRDLTKIPDHIPANRATLISNLETACTGFWDGDPDNDERILIVGFGLIGALLAMWMKLKGYMNLFIYESNTQRRLLAQKLGFSTVDETASFDFDLLYNTSANQAGLQYCIDHANYEGRIIEMSWYGNRTVSLSLGEKFHTKRLSIKSSQVSSIPASMRSIWNFEGRKNEVINMLAHDNWDRLLGIEISLAESVFWFDKIRSGPLDPLTIIIKY